ncbi:hypothetical protein ILYODFUR_003802 [Ilyodon furcidens]|uniref:Uncharacterized protein n=1 Tax=Ilyodon furcidens TaxID=33524 RepID=A0ABV0TTE6_9TELE
MVLIVIGEHHAVCDVWPPSCATLLIHYRHLVLWVGKPAVNKQWGLAHNPNFNALDAYTSAFNTSHYHRHTRGLEGLGFRSTAWCSFDPAQVPVLVRLEVWGWGPPRG